MSHVPLKKKVDNNDALKSFSNSAVVDETLFDKTIYLIYFIENGL